MKKVYLKTVKDINNYVKAGNKIYIDEGNPDPKTDNYIQNIDGVLCCFFNDGTLEVYNAGIFMNLHDYYILSEESVTGVTNHDIGKLCVFADNVEDLDIGSTGIVGRLHEIQEDGLFLREGDIESYCCCRVLTPEEVSNITNYVVLEGE